MSLCSNTQVSQNMKSLYLNEILQDCNIVLIVSIAACPKRECQSLTLDWIRSTIMTFALHKECFKNFQTYIIFEISFKSCLLCNLIFDITSIKMKFKKTLLSRANVDTLNKFLLISGTCKTSFNWLELFKPKKIAKPTTKENICTVVKLYSFISCDECLTKKTITSLVMWCEAPLSGY